MPLITVLTPAHIASVPFLPDTAASVLSQDLPQGWELEWVVQADNGEGHEIHATLPADPRISFGSNDGHRLGPGPTRNLGLCRARGSWVQPLDADDLLLPGALAATIETTQENAGIHWFWGQADDLMPDGRRVHFDPWLSPMGRFPARRFTDWIEEHGGNIPVPVAGISYRTTTLRALGGWGGLPIGEDITLLAAIAELTDGWQSPQKTWLYRQHEGQVSRGANIEQWSEQARLIMLQRIRALRLSATTITGVQQDSDPSPVIAPPMKTTADLN